MLASPHSELRVLKSGALSRSLSVATTIPSMGSVGRVVVIVGKVVQVHCAVLASFMFSNLVDSASSHTLVSKIKPCMSKYKYHTLKLRTAHYISYSLFDSPLLLGYP